MAKKTDFTALSNSFSTQENRSMNYKEIYIIEIQVDERNDSVYQQREEEDEALLDSIKKVGLLTPLLVRRNLDGQLPWKLESGHRRLRQLKRLGHDKAPCYIKEIKEESAEETELLQSALLIEANKQRKKSDDEIAREIEILDEVYKQLRSLNPEKYKGIKTRTLIAADLQIGERKVAQLQSNINKKKKDDSITISSTVNRSKRRAYTQKALSSLIQGISPTIGGSDDFITGYNTAKADMVETLSKDFFKEGDEDEDDRLLECNQVNSSGSTSSD